MEPAPLLLPQPRRYLALVLASTRLLLGCQSEAAPAPVPSAKPRVVGKASPKPAAPVLMPGAVPQAERDAHAHAVQASTTVKYSGAIGERLEGDIYYFKVLATRVCDVAGKVAGVEIELEAKEQLAVSPRDVVIGKGGIAFNASQDLQRKLPACSPLLRISTLKSGQVARGFVLFDLPSPPANDLQLIYQPTRWGGAGYVTTPLTSWSGAP